MKIIKNLEIDQGPISAKANLESIVNLENIASIVNLENIVNIVIMNTVRKDLRVNKGKTKTEASSIQFSCLMALIVLLLKTAQH